MIHWVKLHTAIVDDPRIGRLGWAEKGVWVMLLALAGKLAHRDAEGSLTGRLDTLDNVAWYLRTNEADLLPAIEALVRAGLLVVDEDGVLYLSSFAERQAPDSPAERMRRYRARRRTEYPIGRSQASLAGRLRTRHR